MYWGWFCYKSPGELVGVEGHLNSTSCVALLETVLKPSIHKLYDQDELLYIVDNNNPIHRSASVRDWYSANPRFQQLS